MFPAVGNKVELEARANEELKKIEKTGKSRSRVFTKPTREGTDRTTKRTYDIGKKWAPTNKTYKDQRFSKLEDKERDSHNKRLAAGFVRRQMAPISFNGQAGVRVQYVTPKVTGKVARIFHVAAGIGNAIPSLVSGDVNTHWQKGMKGYAETQEEYVEMNWEDGGIQIYDPENPEPALPDAEEEGKELAETTRKNAVMDIVGYNPRDQDSVAEYARKNRHKMFLFHGHGVILVPGETHSRFIFVPGGNVDKPEGIRSIKFWDAKTKHAVTDEASALLRVRKYCALHSDITREVDIEADKLAVKFHPEGGAEKNKIKERIKRAMLSMTMEIDSRGEIYLKAKGIRPCGKGLRLKDISADAWKNVERDHNKKVTEHHQKLEGEKPYASNNRSEATPATMEEGEEERLQRRYPSNPEQYVKPSFKKGLTSDRH